MSDVACVCCAPLVAEVRARGLHAEQLVEGLPVQVSELENPRHRIPWEAFTVFARRASELLGGPEEIEEVAARSATQTVPRWIQRLLPRLGSARGVYLVGARWWGPWVFRGTRASCEEIADGRLREVIEILPDYAACPEFFQGVRGVLRSMPRLFGQPEAVVDLTQDGRRAEFIIASPPSKHRARLRLRGPARPTPEDLSELAEYGFRQDQLRESERRTRAAVRLLADRSRQLETLQRLQHALTEQPDAPGVITAIVRLLEQEFPVRGIRLSGISLLGETVTRVVESGERPGVPTRRDTLRFGGHEVGRLEWWVSDKGALDDAARLDQLLPWIGVALENLRVGAALERVSLLLAENVEDWQLVEQRLEQLLHTTGCTTLEG